MSSFLTWKSLGSPRLCTFISQTEREPRSASPRQHPSVCPETAIHRGGGEPGKRPRTAVPSLGARSPNSGDALLCSEGSGDMGWRREINGNEEKRARHMWPKKPRLFHKPERGGGGWASRVILLSQATPDGGSSRTLPTPSWGVSAHVRVPFRVVGLTRGPGPPLDSPMVLEVTGTVGRRRPGGSRLAGLIWWWIDILHHGPCDVAPIGPAPPGHPNSGAGSYITSKVRPFQIMLAQALSMHPRTERSPVRFRVRAHA